MWETCAREGGIERWWEVLRAIWPRALLPTVPVAPPMWGWARRTQRGEERRTGGRVRRRGRLISGLAKARAVVRAPCGDSGLFSLLASLATPPQTLVKACRSGLFALLEGRLSGSWKTWIGWRGGVARALMYMDVCYEEALAGHGCGGAGAAINGRAEPDCDLGGSQRRGRVHGDAVVVDVAGYVD